MTIGIVVMKGKGEVTPHPARPGSPPQARLQSFRRSYLRGGRLNRASGLA